MPLTYTILPGIGLVYVRYWGVLNVQETTETFARFSRDPLFRPDLKHLIDMKDVVEYERSFLDLMKLQANVADTILKAPTPVHLVYYAPTRMSLSLARTILKSWDGLGSVIGRIAQDEEQALVMLGLGHQRFADLPMNRV
ncbi:hypothetical protein [Pseudooceanicola atlanticus]|uniref:hypothetical protein n=1 Tax=Pseudooceanicola atlanticus TaxID=1461694 RepID=UPI0023556FFB|nr:hypothetical protein [Pseudooceanicola atlanticus]